MIIIHIYLITNNVVCYQQLILSL